MSKTTSRSNSIRPASRARLASPDELVVEIEPTKRPAPDATEVEPPNKLAALPAAPSTWQTASLATPPPAFGTPPPSAASMSRGRSLGVGLPDDPVSPGPGAGVEEVRVWEQRSAVRLDGQQTALLREFHLQKVQINRLQSEVDRHALLEQRIAVLENQPGQVQLEVGRIEEEVKRQSTGMSSKTAADFMQLRSELSAFAAQIETATAHIQAVEAQHQAHVTTAFTKAEKAIEQLNGSLQEVRSAAFSAAAGSSNEGGPGSTVNFFDY